MSAVSSLYEIARVFEIAESPDFFGSKRSWLAANRLQEEFLPLYKSMKGLVATLDGERTVGAVVSQQAHDVNRWLVKNGAAGDITNLESDGSFYAGCVSSHNIELAVPGVPSAIQGKNGQIFPAGVKLKRGVEYFNTDYSDEKVVSIALSNPLDRLFILKKERVPTEMFMLLDFVTQIERHLMRAKACEYVHFPMVSISQQKDVSWLRQIWTQREGDFKRVALADIRHYVRFRLSEKGLMSGVSQGFLSTPAASARIEPLIVDRPFLLWVSREGYPLPIFVAHIGYSDWKDPVAR